MQIILTTKKKVFTHCQKVFRNQVPLFWFIKYKLTRTSRSKVAFCCFSHHHYTRWQKMLLLKIGIFLYVIVIGDVHTKCWHLILIPGCTVPALACLLGVELLASHYKTNHIFLRRCFEGNYCHIVGLDLHSHTHLSGPFSLGGHFLLSLHGASDLMTMDANMTEVLSAYIASVLPTMTGEEIQGEESGCRSS